MAFITNEKREGLIKNVNQSYAWKKALVLLEIIFLIAFIVMAFISWNKAYDDPDWAWIGGDDKLTNLGIGMLVAGCIVCALGVVTVVVVFTLRSPKSIKKDIKTLESSALSGKKINKSESAGDVMRARRNPVNAESKATKEAKAKSKKSK